MITLFSFMKNVLSAMYVADTPSFESSSVLYIAPTHIPSI